MADALATVGDVAIRLGRALTESEQALATQVIASVTGQVYDTTGKDADWLADLDPVPTYLTSLCVEKVIVVGSNPLGLASESEQLGERQRSRTYQRANDGGVFLTDYERREVRRVVNGTTFAAVTYETPYSGDDTVDELELPLP